MMRSILRLFRRREYKPLNNITVDEKNLISNYMSLGEINPNVHIAPVLKSNAYGHGIKKVASVIDKLNAPFVCVDSIFEGYQLLKEKVKTPVLIMGYIDPTNLLVKKLPFSYAVFNLAYALDILKAQPKAQLHLFLDTGMNREGFRFDELQEFIKVMKEKKLEDRITGLMSHFASADEDLNPQTDNQLKVFNEGIRLLEDNGIYLKFKHISASFGILNNKNLNCNVARGGLAFYGYGDEKLKPALELTTKVAQIKDLKKGELVGYNATFSASKEMKIAILPIGYNDGLDRRLSNKGYATIKGVYCPIIGRISMNITTIDISNLYEVHKGISEKEILKTPVVLISKHPKDNNSIANIAKTIDTIPYEILVGLNPFIRRTIN